MSERIDAHHHLWHYTQEDYGWIGQGMEMLARDFLPADLEKERKASGIDGCVAVQALQNIEETEWLLSLASESRAIRGVVGWAPISSPELAGIVEKWSDQKKLKGLRHLIQDEPSEEFIHGQDFNRGIASLAGTGLVYDILIYERHLAAAISFVDRHPNQVF